MTIVYADLSQYSWDRHGGLPDFAALKAAGTEVVVIRASYGDPKIYSPATRHFREMATAAKAAGLFVGGYHNLIHGDAASIARQVDYFKAELDAVGADWAMLDIEPYEALVTNGLWPRLEDAVAFEQRWNAVEPVRELALYLARWFWARTADQHGLGSPDLTVLSGPLIAANYPGGNPAGSPADLYTLAGGDTGPGWAGYGGKAPTVWQYSSKATWTGVSSTEDANAYQGTVADFKAGMRKGVPMDKPDFKLTKPNPYSNATDAEWWLWLAFKGFEPEVQLGGIYADKRGFHNRGDQVWDSGQGNPATDYSIRDGVNREGPYWRTKASAIDITFPSAQRGDYGKIAKYSKRLWNSMRDSADPRLSGVFEFYGQTDSDTHVEGWDEYHENEVTSDSSHLWHIHISFLRSKCHDFWTMWAVLTVLQGWTVAQWKASLPGGVITVPVSNPTSALPTYTLGSRLLKLGAKGTDVRDAQKLLVSRGYSIAADGIFGTATLAAVKSFQSKRYLGADGIIGPDTIAALRSNLGYRVLKKTSPDTKGTDVAELQRRLKITADGDFGPKTDSAVKAFQGKHGLTKDGDVGPKTLAKLWAAT